MVAADDRIDGPGSSGGDSPFFLPTPSSAPLGHSRRFGVRHLMGFVLACALLFWLSRSIGPAAVLTFFFALLLSIGLGAILLLLRSGNGPREMMQWLVANAAEKNLPLGPGIQAVGELSGGTFRLKADRLTRLIDEGLALPEAIDRVPGVFPTASLIYTRMGWNGRLLGRALRDESANRSAGRLFAQGWSLRVAFLIWTLIVLQFLYGFSNYFIAPKLEAIFADFGTELPSITTALFRLNHFLLGAWLIPLLLAELALLPLIALAFFDPMHWRVPVLDWWLLRRHGGVVSRVLATEVEAARPIHRSFQVLATQYPSWLIRRRIAIIDSRVSHGESWIDAFQGSGLIREVDAEVLRAADRLGNLPWALRDLADGAEKRFERRIMALGQCLFPVVILVVSSFVGLYAVAYFLPLIKLIQELAQ